MRLGTLSLAALLIARTAAAAPCEPAHADSGSASRAVSDVPYAPAPPAPTCKPAAEAPGLEPSEAWSAEANRSRVSAYRVGEFGVVLGGILLLNAAEFAICAKHASDPSTRDFCHGGTVPLLVAGAVSSTLGVGTIALGTWLLPETSPEGHAALSGGLKLKWAWDGPGR